MYRNTYIEINLDNIFKNAKNIINAYKGYKYYIGVVKSNCYGHGNYCVTELVKAGINYLAVSNLLEAKNIRKINKVTPMLCLEPINLEYIDEILKNDIAITVTSLEYLKELKKLGKNKNLKIHLKINSGMNRLGFDDKNELVEAFTIIDEYFTLEGIFSHFATTGYLDKKYNNQVNKFKDITSLIDLKKVKIVHLGKSASLINHEKLDFCNGVRLGIILYGINVGIYKSSNILRRIKHYFVQKINTIESFNYGCDAKLFKSLSLYSEVIDIKFIKKNEYVGYGLTSKLKKDSNIAVVSIGYADGIKIKGKNRLVCINEKNYEILSVCMGMIIIKIDNTVKLGDKVEIFGNNINVSKEALKCESSSYELYANLHEVLPRVFVKNGKKVYAEIWEVK